MRSLVIRIPKAARDIGHQIRGFHTDGLDIGIGDQSGVDHARDGPVAPAFRRLIWHGFDENTTPATESLEPIGIALCYTIIRTGFDERSVPEGEILRELA